MFSEACVKNSVHRGEVYPGIPLGRPPQADTPLGRQPSQTLWDTVNKQAVRILLECILVSL